MDGFCIREPRPGMRKSSNIKEELFGAALALPTTERGRYLDRACAGDRELRASVCALLDASDEAAQFVKEPTRRFENAGDQIGSYRLLHELGEGGGGTVYLAEQVTPIKREVALKIIKLGMDTRAVISRFEAERQALALMDHPNIARVFDAGATPTGRPYFVMELVRGIKITEYCDQVRLGVRARLALFIQVCQAIQHAHHKGVIHRDIKPSNVLVTLHDGAPIAKVIDFGIAKATQGRLTDHTLYTALEQFIGTPAYVSPEQTEPGGLNVDTRSDVYSLGVLLYELLTGCTPFDTDELLQTGLDDMRQRIREEQPPAPSKRLKSLADVASHSISARYQTAAGKLIKEIHGDLDWVVMRCLEKESARRYQTANELVLELQRYLHHEPVVARRPNIAYAFHKFAQRHRAVFATGATIVVVLLVATAISIWQAVRATHAERLAQKTIDSLVNVFAAADPFTTQGAELTARELLDRAGRTARADLNDFPKVQARLLESIGKIHRRRGEIGESVPYLEDAIRIFKNMPDAGGSATLTAMVELAVTLRYAGDLRGSRELVNEGIALAQRLGQQRSAIYANLLTNRGRIERDLGNIAAARKYLEEGLALSREILGPRDKEVAVVLLAMSGILQWTDELPAAENAAREALEIFEAVAPPLYPDRVLAETYLGEVLYLVGRVDEAAPLLENALVKHSLLFGKNSVEVADILDTLARIRGTQGLLAAAVDLGQQAIQISVKARGSEHFRTAYFRNSLALLLAQRGKYGEAEAQVRQSLAIYAKTLPADHQYVASSEYLLGEVLLATNRLSEAETVLTASMNRWRRTNSAEWRSARSACALGEVLSRQGRALEAERYLIDSYHTLATADNADREAVEKSRERLTRFYMDTRQSEKLQQILTASDRDELALQSP